MEKSWKNKEKWWKHVETWWKNDEWGWGWGWWWWGWWCSLCLNGNNYGTMMKNRDANPFKCLKPMGKLRAEEWWTHMMIPLQSLEFRMLHFQRKQNQNPLARRGWPSPFCHVSSLATRLPLGLRNSCLDGAFLWTPQVVQHLKLWASCQTRIHKSWSYTENGDELLSKLVPPQLCVFRFLIRLWGHGFTPQFRSCNSQGHRCHTVACRRQLVLLAESPIKAASYDNYWRPTPSGVSMEPISSIDPLGLHL